MQKLKFLQLLLTSVLVTLSINAKAIDQNQLTEIANNKQWLNLGHWKKKIWGNFVSEADGLDFFLSTEGKTNPLDELIITIKSFESESFNNRKNHPLCQFPARAKFLKKMGLLNKLPNVTCADLNTFRERVAAKSATLVFSSYFLNNPASAFGHTLLRLNKSRSNEKKDYALLDYGVNYAANPTTSNAVAYAILGVVGGFTGTFASMPYYLKVREYADYESRDLWEYDLALTEDEVDTLVLHLWELGSTYFNYFYFTENCSYHILRTIEAAAPQYNFEKRMSYIVIPADTVKVVTNTKDFVQNINFRPSSRTIFKSRYNDLNATEKTSALKIAESDSQEEINKLLNEFEIQSKARILDSAIDYIDFKYSKKIIEATLKNEPNDISDKKQKLLSMRAKLLIPSSELKVQKPEKEMPHIGHKSRRFTVFAGNSNQYKNHTGFGLRFALHDFNDPTPGYPEVSKIIFFGGNTRYNSNTSKWWIEDGSLFHVESLTPIRAYDQTPSWKARLGFETIRDNTCNTCNAAILRTGAGFTIRPTESHPIMLFVSADVHAAFSKGFNYFSRFGIGPYAMFRYIISPTFLITATSQYNYYFNVQNKTSNDHRIELRKRLGRDFAIGTNITKYFNSIDYQGSLFVYF